MSPWTRFSPRRGIGAGVVLAAAVLLGPVASAVPVPSAPDAASAVPGQEGGGAAPGGAPPRPIRWAALGDSYSAGEGLNDSEPPCHRSDRAWAPRARQTLEEEDGWTVEQFDFVACTGAQAGPDTSSGETEHFRTQLERLSGPYDLVTFSIGGNDAGFSPIITSCLAHSHISDAGAGCTRLLHDWNTYHEIRGDPDVGVTLNAKTLEALRRIDEAAARGRNVEFQREVWRTSVQGIECHDTAGDDRGYRCNDRAAVEAFALTADEYDRRLMAQFEEQLLARMRLDTLPGVLTELYQTVERDHLAPGGRIVVMGYPRLFEPPDRWPWLPRRLGACWGVAGRFAEVFRRAGDALNAAVEQAVSTSAAATFVSPADAFEGHNVCAEGGSDAEWLNALTPGLGRTRPPRTRYQASFHPNDPGFRAMADLLVAHLRDLPWDELPPDDDSDDGPGDDSDDGPGGEGPDDGEEHDVVIEFRSSSDRLAMQESRGGALDDEASDDEVCDGTPNYRRFHWPRAEPARTYRLQVTDWVCALGADPNAPPMAFTITVTVDGEVVDTIEGSVAANSQWEQEIGPL